MRIPRGSEKEHQKRRSVKLVSREKEQRKAGEKKEERILKPHCWTLRGIRISYGLEKIHPKWRNHLLKKGSSSTRKHNTPRFAALPGAHWHVQKSPLQEEETRSDSSGIRARNPEGVKRISYALEKLQPKAIQPFMRKRKLENTLTKQRLYVWQMRTPYVRHRKTTPKVSQCFDSVGRRKNKKKCRLKKPCWSLHSKLHAHFQYHRTGDHFQCHQTGDHTL